MASKRFINDPTQLVSQALHALVHTNPSLVHDQEEKVVRYLKRPNTQPTVSIISGGGAGHEPAFGAYVGKGLLSAAVSGTIFASPNSNQVLHAIESIEKSQGVLVVVMNYTGDVLNFGVAVEKAKARDPNLQIELLVVGDDVGVPRSQAGKVGRRGIAGTCLVQKILGAAAEQSYGLHDILKLGHVLCERLASVGVSLDRVNVPGSVQGVQSLNHDEVELGMGIHNEAGSGKLSGPQAKLPSLVKELLRQILSREDSERAFIESTSGKAILLVNNLGGLSPLEVGAVTTEVIDQLHANHQISPLRVLSGTFMTSLNGPGFSISLLFLDPGLEDEVLRLLDSPTEARGWVASSSPQSWEVRGHDETCRLDRVKLAEVADSSSARAHYVCDMDAIVRHLKSGLAEVTAAESDVTYFDTVVGDGDCGITLKRGAEELQRICQNPPQEFPTLLSQLAQGVERSMDGTSGALYSIFLNALGAYFLSLNQNEVVVDQKAWCNACTHATETLSRYTPARTGDRTLMDALIPFQDALSAGQSIAVAAEEAMRGAETTRHLRAKLGRAVYVGEQDSWVGTIPDPGAWGLSKFLVGLSRS